jgi:hypothetical protein
MEIDPVPRTYGARVIIDCYLQLYSLTFYLFKNSNDGYYNIHDLLLISQVGCGVVLCQDMYTVKLVKDVWWADWIIAISLRGNIRPIFNSFWNSRSTRLQQGLETRVDWGWESAPNHFIWKTVEHKIT